MTQERLKDTMLTTKKTDTAKEPKAAAVRSRPGMRPFAWSPFSVIPKKETQKVIGLSDSAKRLWLVLVLSTGGFAARVEFQNEKLRKAAGIGNENTFRDARKELRAAGVLIATPVEGTRKEKYLYSLAPESQRRAQAEPKGRIKRPSAAPTVRRRKTEREGAMAHSAGSDSWGEEKANHDDHKVVASRLPQSGRRH